MNSKVQTNWPTVFDHYRKSGLSRAEYCRINKLSSSSFAYHAKGHEAGHPRSDLKEASTSFITVRERSEFKLKINDSLTLSFDSLPDAAWLSTFLKMLGGDHACS